MQNTAPARALVTGCFSFPWSVGWTTAGDLLARDVVEGWLRRAGIACDVVNCAPVPGGVRHDAVEPARYTHFIFVCGPFTRDPHHLAYMQRFAHCRLLGINLSMVEALDAYNPFDLLYERDSPRATRPDVVFGASAPRVPVVGLVLVHPQAEYGARSRHDAAHDALHALLGRTPCAVVPVDTCLYPNEGGLRTPEEVESLLARMDVVVTTRLHGTVLALKNGVPVLAVDPVAGGAKLVMQTRAVGWDNVFAADAVDAAKLDAAFAWCLTPEARDKAAACARAACATIEALGREVTETILGAPPANATERVWGLDAPHLQPKGPFTRAARWLRGNIQLRTRAKRALHGTLRSILRATGGAEERTGWLR